MPTHTASIQNSIIENAAQPRKTLAVMQPTYLPWAGYFNLIQQADIFVFLDDVQFEKQSWQNRNRVLVNGHPHWLTVPVRRNGLNQPIRDVQIDSSSNWQRKHCLLLQQTYGNFHHGKAISPILDILRDNTILKLCDLNILIIQKLCSILKIPIPTIRSSTLEMIGQRSERLILFCNHFNCTEYLSPVGAKDYIEQDGQFAQSSIMLRFQNYVPEPYSQPEQLSFVSHLSILDVLANIGIEATQQYISTNSQPQPQCQ